VPIYAGYLRADEAQPSTTPAVIEKLAANLTALLKEQCPDAKIEIEKGVLKAHFQTMKFTLHQTQMTGEILPQTYETVGPNYGGFQLFVSVEPGTYTGQPVLGQDNPGPYWTTYMNAKVLSGKKSEYLSIYLQFGGRKDNELIDAIKKVVNEADEGK